MKGVTETSEYLLLIPFINSKMGRLSLQRLNKFILLSALKSQTKTDTKTYIYT